MLGALSHWACIFLCQWFELLCSFPTLFSPEVSPLPWLRSYILMVSGSPAPNPILNSRSMYFHWKFIFPPYCILHIINFPIPRNNHFLSFYFFCLLLYLWKIIALKNMIIFLLLDFFSFRSIEIFYRKLELIMSNWIGNLPLFPLIILNVIHHKVKPPKRVPCLSSVTPASFLSWLLQNPPS